MDDFTKKDKYSSLNSAIKDIVQQNNDLYQKSLRERFGVKDEPTQTKQTLDESLKEIRYGIETGMTDMGVRRPEILIKSISRKGKAIEVRTSQWFGKDKHEKLAKMIRAKLKSYKDGRVENVGVYEWNN